MCGRICGDEKEEACLKNGVTCTALFFDGRKGAKLFNRGGHSITLTNEGLLLKRQALEIVDLEEKILSDFKGDTESVEGKITIGCGEFLAVEVLAKICKNYKEKYPLVQFGIHTGTAISQK